MNRINIFICGFLVMALEIAVKRMLIPAIGSDLYSWTLLLTVSLAACAVGYAAGGYLKKNHMVMVLVFASILTGTAPLIFQFFFSKVFLYSIPINLLRLIFCFIFAFPLLFLSCFVYPHFASLISKNSHIKNTISSASALSSLGGVAGALCVTFVFFEVLQWDVARVFIFLSLLFIFLIVLSHFPKKQFVLVLTLLYLAGIFYITETDLNLESKSVYKKNSGIQKITIHQSSCWSHLQNKCNFLFLGDNAIVQGAVDVSQHGKPAIYHTFGPPLLAWTLNPRINKVLIIGFGAGIGSRDILRLFPIKQYPHFQLDAVDIDGHLLDVAKNHFDFPQEDQRFKFYPLDGRVFLNHMMSHKYDLIYMDAEMGLAKSSHLLSYESFLRARDLLTENGVVLVNTIGSVQSLDRKSKYESSFAALYKTVRKAFYEGSVFVFDEHYIKEQGFASGARIRNIFLLVSKHPQPIFFKRLDRFKGKVHASYFELKNKLVDDKELADAAGSSEKIYYDSLNLAPIYYKKIEQKLFY